MPDAETNALRRAKTLREKINARTGIADTTVTEGVKRLLRNRGTEVAIQHEAAMHFDIYPDPIIAREEFSRMMDYGEFEVSEVDFRTVFDQFEYAEFTGNSNQVIQFDFTLQATDKFLIDLEIADNIGTGVSNAGYSGNSCSTITTRNHIMGSNYISFRKGESHKVPNVGRGIFGKDYSTGEVFLYNQVAYQTTSPSDYNAPNYTNYILGCWLEMETRYYYMYGKFYNLKTWRNGVLTRDIYPGDVNSYLDGSLIESQRGLYDIINKKMYPAPNLVYPNSYIS